MAGFERLAVISTYREHAYGNLDDIQQELSSKVLQLAPPNLKASAKVKLEFLFLNTKVTSSVGMFVLYIVTTAPGKLGEPGKMFIC